MMCAKCGTSGLDPQIAMGDGIEDAIVAEQYALDCYEPEREMHERNLRTLQHLVACGPVVSDRL